jgi:hypothetical protein
MSVGNATNSAEESLGGLAEHLTGIRVEGGVQRQRAMAKVLARRVCIVSRGSK